MSNTHGIPDMAKEVQALCGDLLPPVILSTTWPTVPAASLTLAAFATKGYVRDGTDLIYVEQAAAAVTLSGGDGAYWLALHRNTTTAVSSWTRQAGTHYLWRSNPTQPAQPSGGLILAHVTVAGGVITAVSTLATPQLPLSRQTADAVAITGGHVTSLTTVSSQRFDVLNLAGNDVYGYVGNIADGGGTNRYNLYLQGTAPNYMQGALTIIGPTGLATLGVQVAPQSNVGINLVFTQPTQYGIAIRNSGADTGTAAILFSNVAGSVIGSITTTAGATAYNTSSDVRLKHAIAQLAGALAVIAALKPVKFRWNADDSSGIGFLAHELQQVIPEAVTGEPDALDAQGNIAPQQVDHSKIIPHLVSAMQELAQQVQTLAARVTALEQALGV